MFQNHFRVKKNKKITNQLLESYEIKKKLLYLISCDLRSSCVLTCWFYCREFQRSRRGVKNGLSFITCWFSWRDMIQAKFASKLGIRRKRFH